MTFDPFAEEPAPEEVETMVDDAIASNEVVLFMKGDRLMPQCGFSQRAVELISRHRDEFETVDVLPALGSFRASLEEYSGWETIPQTFVDGEFVGGSDILAELESRDELSATLNAD